MGMEMEAVEDVGGFTLRGGDDAGRERPEPTRHMGIENAAGIDAVFCIDVAGACGTAAGAEILTAGRGSRAVIPDGGIKVLVVRVDDAARAAT